MKTTGAAPSRQLDPLGEWSPTKSDFKQYPHFDAPLSLSEIRSLVSSPERVAQNSFFPLLHYEKTWQPFRTPRVAGQSQAGPKPAPKDRKIRYASRRDAYIYAKYRKLLYPLYEHELRAREIDDVPTAYRKILGKDGKGKCNIDFANDAFSFIKECGECFVITLDISKFFESIDHKKIESIWIDLLKCDKLPKDHGAIFKSITQYRWVDRTEAYERLGYFGYKTDKKGKVRKGFLRPHNKMPKQLCSPKNFREKIAGEGQLPSIIKCHDKPYGIPQGTPISDLVANFYMMDFDKFIKGVAEKSAGKAFRYSDDIMIIAKLGTVEEALSLEIAVRDSIKSFGDQLFIKESKSSIHQFSKNGEKRKCRHIKGAGKNGLEYLGFRFDGNNVYLKDSTISNLRRKLTRSAQILASEHAKKFPSRSVDELVNAFNFDFFFQKFMRVEEFDKARSVRDWTFWTYARRAAEAFGGSTSSIIRQIKWLKPDGKRHVIKQFVKMRS